MAPVVDPLAAILLLLAAASYSIGHGARLLMRRGGWGIWAAGVAAGFAAFLVSRGALAGAAWLIIRAIYGDAPPMLALISLVGLASTPLVLAFIKAMPFVGPTILVLLYVIAQLRLVTLYGVEPGMTWLGSLGLWSAAWLTTSLASMAITRVLRNARWLRWTGLWSPHRESPGELLAVMPGMKDAIRE